MTSLTEDCIYHIFLKLKDDRTILYKFLFVNRYFCKNTIPLLYCNTFEQEINQRQTYLLMDTYLRCLDTKERTYLQQCIDINLPNEMESTLFEYEKYLEKLSIKDLIHSVESWLLYQLNEANNNFDKQQQENIKRIFYEIDKETKLKIHATFFHMFIRKSVKLNYLEIKPIIFNSEFLNIQFLNEISKNLSNLTCLRLSLFTEYSEKIRGRILFDFLNVVAKNCSRIKELRIITREGYVNYDFSSYIINIINNQRNLLKFRLSDPRNVGTSTISSLESQKYSLSSLQLDYIHLNDKNISILANCSNLKSLQLYYCGGITLDYCNNILSKSSFRIEHLTMTRNRWSKHVTTSIINIMGESLRKLSFDQISSESLESIISCCPKLLVLEIQFGKFDYSLLNKTRIEHLIIHPIFNLSLDLKDLKGLLQDLGKSLPKTIRHFTFISHNTLSPNNLENFLNNCSLITLNFYLDMSNDLLKIIINYIIEQKSLRYLGIRRRVSLLGKTGEKLDEMLLDKIKSLGIKITFFKEIYNYNLDLNSLII